MLTKRNTLNKILRKRNVQWTYSQNEFNSNPREKAAVVAAAATAITINATASENRNYRIYLFLLLSSWINRSVFWLKQKEEAGDTILPYYHYMLPHDVTYSRFSSSYQKLNLFCVILSTISLFSLILLCKFHYTE